MNKVILLGRLTRDPETRYSQAAEPLAVTRYSLAVRRRATRKEGEPDAEFINCVAFGQPAEFAEKYFKKGQMVAVTGRLQTRSWDDQTGQKRWSTEVVIEEQHFAESKSSSDTRPPMEPPIPLHKQDAPGQPFYEPDGFSAIAESIDDDELPF